jgi:uncharacterized protein (DUF433 family)
MSEQDRIVIAPRVMAGKPIIKGTRVTVERVLNLLAQRMTIPQLLEEYRHVSEADIRACLAYGASLAGASTD